MSQFSAGDPGNAVDVPIKEESPAEYAALEAYRPEGALPYPRGFRPRRGLNWGYLGLLYTSFYLCRYNLSVANKSIADQFKFSYFQMSVIIVSASLIYAFGQIINGLLTDRIGGKKAMMIGAFGTVAMNLLFGAASYAGMFFLFVGIRGIDGYFQSFGAPGMTKIKTAWFVKTERGGFAGIFGFMINLGRLGIFTFGPALLTGSLLFGMFTVPPLHWRWLFWGPSIICALVAVAMWFGVKETPEENGFFPVEFYTPALPTLGQIVVRTIVGLLVATGLVAIFWLWHEGWIGTLDMGLAYVGAMILIFIVLHLMALAFRPDPNYLRTVRDAASESTRSDIGAALRAIAGNPAVWVVAGAYACTGAVRQPMDQWFPRYMQEVHQADMKSSIFQFLGFAIPITASAGSYLSGIVSDKLFGGSRSPVAAFLYATETVIVLLATWYARTPWSAAWYFVALSFTCNATHSILGTAAAMDIGGRRMTGFASGVIDSFQYFGGTIAGLLLGVVLDRFSMGALFPFLIPFGVIGAYLMIRFGGTIARNSHR
jgi:OPA family glycerol-3-phosphate transporter-like MFS transporter